MYDFRVEGGREKELKQPFTSLSRQERASGVSEKKTRVIRKEQRVAFNRSSELPAGGITCWKDWTRVDGTGPEAAPKQRVTVPGTLHGHPLISFLSFPKPRPSPAPAPLQST